MILSLCLFSMFKYSNKKSLPKQKTIQDFNIDAQGFRKTRNENLPMQEIGVTSYLMPADLSTMSWLAGNDQLVTPFSCMGGFSFLVFLNPWANSKLSFALVTTFYLNLFWLVVRFSSISLPRIGEIGKTIIETQNAIVQVQMTINSEP